MDPEEVANTSSGVNLDVLTPDGSGGFTSSGPIAQRIMQTGGNVRIFAESMRTMNLLRKDEWNRLDSTVLDIARERLNVTNRLVGRGLVYDLPNALGTMRLDWERMGDMGPAEMQMSGLVEGATDRITFDLVSLPIPIIWKEFNLNARHLAASRNGSTPLDVTQAAVSARKVAERVESLIVNGESGLNFGSTVLNIPGMLTAPDASTLADVWPADDELSSDSERLAFFNKLIDGLELLNQDAYYGPFVVYVPRNLWYSLITDWKANSDKTVLDRIRDIPGISDIFMSDSMPSNKMVMMQETMDVVDIVRGIEPTTITWESRAGFISHFMIFTIMVPRFKSTKTKQSGVLIGTRTA